ncbi:MAG: substrate-binding domain-containing protein [Nocardioides sp.]
MSVRSFCAALGATAVVTSGLALSTLAPASADPASTPSATDYVGVGSDTTQFVVTDLINGRTVNGQHVNGYNETVAAGAPHLASWDACTVPAGKMYPCTPGSSTDSTQFITLRTGATAIPRPNGSGAGKALLYGAKDNPSVTFARSSGGLNDAEVSAGLKAYPFAVDTLVAVTAPVTNAPASLTPQQLLGIYNGTYTNWSQVGGKDGVINALKPQSGSGTLSFFVAQLQKIAGDSTFQPKGHDHELADTATGAPCATASATCVDTLVQEHDPTLVTHDPNAIAPFSLGRANLAGPDSVSVLKGWNARRALYNVLRSKDAGNATPDNPAWFAGTDAMNAVFGKDGFLCSAAARPIIEANGFKQLLSFNDGGACGLPVGTTSAPDLSVYDSDGVNPVVSATVSGTTYGAVHQVAVTVTGAGGTPTGAVSVNLGSWTGSGTLSGGTATITAPATLPAGSYDAAVTYQGDSNFRDASTDVALVVAKARTVSSETFAATVKRSAKTLAGTVKVVLAPASSVAASGPVRVLKGSKVLALGTVRNGVAHLSLKVASLSLGKNALTVKYAGTGNLAGSAKKFTVTKK